MPQDLQSIEDLIKTSQGEPADEESIEGKFAKKQKEIKLKEIERDVSLRADSLGLSYIKLIGFAVSPEALSLIKEEDAKRFLSVCFYYDGDEFRVGTVNPENPELPALMEELETKTYAKGKVYLISETSFNYALGLYKMVPKVKKFSGDVQVTERDLDRFSDKFSSFRDLQDLINSAQITDIVSMIMAASIKTRSSDVHIEAEENAIKVRFRIDGVLVDAATVDKEMWKKIISRLKILTKVKINIMDKPQDGRMSIVLKDEKIDIRASFLPTNYGESVVMRLLRSSSMGLAFEDLGLRGRAFEQLKREVERPNGMIITTGPTGSGKTTSLYAILKKLNNPQTKIITIEDPIEYQLGGINQSQVSAKYTFAQGLRSIVRQDPDIVMVGEIRDLETAEIAIQAALTGHLVLSTIHTNDASGTVPRFLSMGVKPFLLAPALNAMIGQRLVRKICPECKEEDNVSDENLKRIKDLIAKLPKEEKEKIDTDKMIFYKGKGCEACQDLGYKGRIGIYEIMTMNSEVEKLIMSGHVSEYDMLDVALKNGMITMVQDGILKALEGITSIEEVFRVAE